MTQGGRPCLYTLQLHSNVPFGSVRKCVAYSWNVFVRRASNRSREFVVRFAFLNRVLRLRKSLEKIQIINCKPAQCLDLDLQKGNRHSSAGFKQHHCVKKCLKARTRKLATAYTANIPI